MIIRYISIAAIVLLAAVPLACGGDDGDATSATPESAATTSADSTEPSLPEPVSAQGAERVQLSDRLVTELSSAEEPDWLVAAFGSVWAKQGSGDLLRVDLETGKLVAELGDRKPGERPPGGHLCQGLGASDDAIWSCPQVGTIARIDPKTNSIDASVRIDNQGDQGRLVSAAGSLWVLTDRGAKLTAIDERTNKPATTIPLGASCVDLAAAATTVWVTCPLEDRLLRVDAKAGEVSDELALPGAANASVSDDLWVGFEGGVAQIDQETLEVLAVYDVYPRYGGAIFATPDAVWVRVEGGPFLTRIDPRAKRIVETISAPKLASGGDVIQVGDSVWATAYDDGALVELDAGP